MGHDKYFKIQYIFQILRNNVFNINAKTMNVARMTRI